MGDHKGASGFDWRVYADATSAGLTALIPLPLVDVALEGAFRRRMPGTIARVRGRELDRLVAIRLGRSRPGGGPLAGCVAMPFMLARYIVKKLWRKIIYVFAVADATGQVSEYWHRAYLIDHVLRAGHLERGADVERALAVFTRAISEADTSPLRLVAREVVAGSGRVLRLLVRARRRGPDEEIESLAEILGEHWGAAERSLRAVAVRYNRLYESWPNDPDHPGAQST